MKIIIVATTSWNIYNHRLLLIRALKNAMLHVVILAKYDAYTPRLIEHGFDWIDLPTSPRGINPIIEIKTVYHLYKIYRSEKPDIVHHFTPKGVIYGSIAAHLNGVEEIINTITGLGYVFSGHSLKKFFFQILTMILYGVSLKRTKVVFQNPEDMRRLRHATRMTKEKLLLSSGSGVNLSKFIPTMEPSGRHVILMAARLMPEKGVFQFVEAARILIQQGYDVRFVLVGIIDEYKPRSLTIQNMMEWVKEGAVEWWGWKDNMEEIYQKAHIVCLPTYYGEGVPQSLIEAAACARPLVATDIPGCRKIVREGENGYLVPAKDSTALARAIKTLLDDEKLRVKMGLRSREIAESEFSTAKNISDYFSVYGLAESS